MTPSIEYIKIKIMNINLVKKTAFTIFGLVVLLSSCENEDPVTISEETTSHFATIDNLNGTPMWVDIPIRGEMSAILHQDTSDGYQVLNLSGVGDNSGFINFYVSRENKLSEAYSVGPHKIDLFAIGEIVYESTASSLDLTHSDAGSHTVSGAFSFEGKERGGSKTISIVNGAFHNVKYRVSFYQ